MRIWLATALSLALAVPALAQNYYGDIGGLKILNPADKVDVKSVPPPPGARVLFDGASLDGWVHRDGKSVPKWQLLPGGIMQVKGGDIITKEKFAGRFNLHVEFRCPYQPDKKGQGRGNSGVYLQGRYEVQVLDSYGVKSQMGDCGAIYGVAIPTKNACKAPTVWQSYDIDFTAPTCANGKKTAPGIITVYHNGVKIHDKVVITKDNTTAGMGGDPCTPGPILLQDHGDPVQYRNVWLLPVKE